VNASVDPIVALGVATGSLSTGIVVGALLVIAARRLSCR
jgi:hypothetical protein